MLWFYALTQLEKNPNESVCYINVLGGVEHGNQFISQSGDVKIFRKIIFTIKFAYYIKNWPDGIVRDELSSLCMDYYVL